MRYALVNIIRQQTTGEILHTAEKNMVVAIVFEPSPGHRVYWAQEFTKDGQEVMEAAGYRTTEKHWYMGERYRDRYIWGPYFSEVYWVDGESSREVKQEEVTV